MMTAGPWERYRERIEADSSLARRVGFYRWIEDMVDRSATIDAEIAQKARALSPIEYATFLEVLGWSQRKQFGTAPDAAAPDYAKFFTEFLGDLATGKVTDERWRFTDRLSTLVLLFQRVQGMRSVIPVLPPPSRSEQPDLNPAIVTAAEPLFARYGELVPRISPGAAERGLDAELAALLQDLGELRDRCPPGGADWNHVQWGYATVVGALARSAVLQGHVQAAIDRFDQGASVWSELGDIGSHQDCLVRAAEVALADGADMDRALEGILADLDRTAGSPSIRRAELLARCAEMYLGVSDYFDAADRAHEAGEILTALGFPDPSIAGVDVAFGEWVTSSWAEDLGLLPDNRTSGLFAVVATTWTSLMGVRIILPAEAENQHALSEALSELALLVQKLGEHTSQVGSVVWAQAVEAGLAAPLASAEDGSTNPGAGPVDRAVPAPTRLAQRVMDLQDELACSDATEASYHDLAAAADSLETEIRASNLPQLAVTASALRADVLSAMGRFDESVAVLATAVEDLHASVMAEATRRTLAVELLKRQALAYAMLHDDAHLSETCGVAITEVEHDRGKVNGPFLQDSYLRDRRRLYDMGVFSAYKLEDYELMLARAELAKGRGILGWAGAESHGEIRDADRLDPALAKEFRSLSEAVGGEAGTAHGPVEPELLARRRVLWNRFMMARGRAWSSPRTADVGGARGDWQGNTHFDLAAVQAVLAADEAVIYQYWLSRQTLLVVTIDRDAVEVEKVDMEAGERDGLAKLVANLIEMEGGISLFDAELRAFSRRLLPQKAHDLVASKRRLILSPQGILHQLPFDAFWWDGKRLIETFAVSYVPNLTSMLLKRLESARPDVLALGISHFAGPARDLPRSSSEAIAVDAIYQHAGISTTRLIDGEANRETVLRLHDNGTLGHFRVLHLATHGHNGAPDDPFAARLRLYDGTVDGLEIGQWQLHADLVVLSACYLGKQAIAGRHRASEPAEASQAPDEGLFGDEVFGLQAAFFAAGARQVLGALWRVGDEASEAIMTALHANLSRQQPAEVALQQAITDYRATNDSASLWAPYKLVSVGRPAMPAPK